MYISIHGIQIGAMERSYFGGKWLCSWSFKIRPKVNEVEG